MTWKETLQEKPQKGLLVKLMDKPAMVLIAKQCGIDFILYDCEHGVLPYSSLHDLMVLGNQIHMPSIVRVAQLARKDVSQILDYGATGVMVPMIETKQQAQQLVEWSKYPPLGKRSYSGGANTNYGPSGNHAQHMQQANAQTLAIVQIETITGCQNLEEILNVEGIDAVIVGPCDLGISINHPDHVMLPEELALIEQIHTTCVKFNKPFGIIGGTALLQHFKKDLDFFLSAIDTNLFRAGINQAVNMYEDMIGDIQ